MQVEMLKELPLSHLSPANWEESRLSADEGQLRFCHQLLAEVDESSPALVAASPAVEPHFPANRDCSAVVPQIFLLRANLAIAAEASLSRQRAAPSAEPVGY
jgi:hypothetical protein